MKNTFIRIDSELHHVIKVKCAELGVAMSAVTEKLLCEWLSQQEVQDNGTQT